MVLNKLVSRVKSWEENLRQWEGAQPKRERKAYWLVYTACFTVVCFIALLTYPTSGNSLAWGVDGMDQYYPFFIYTGQWVRELIGGLFSGQGLAFPLWDMSLGYGSDIPSVLDVIYNPFYLVSALCPEQYSEYFFQFLVVFRMYLAGVAFSLLALYRGNGRFATLCGALVYALCGTALTALIWPDGINPMILFPLLLVGVEKIFQHKKPYLFMVSLVLFFVMSFYFAYMACLLLLLYCGFRVFVIERRRGNRVTPKLFFTWAAKFAGYLIVSLLVACVVLVPSLLALTSLDRVASGDVGVPAFYTLDYYQKVFAGFLGFASVGSDCFIGFGGFSLLACFLLFIKKGNRNLKVIFIGLTIILLVPALGSVFNGFNYATNRWVWAYALCVAYIVVKMVPLFAHLEKKDFRVLCACAIAYALALFILAGARSEANMAALALLFVLLVFLGWQGLGRRTWRYGLVACISLGLIGNAFYFTSPDEYGWARLSPAIGSMYAKVAEVTPNRLIADIEDESVWRYDADPDVPVGARPRNSSAVLDINGFDFYNSVYENDIDRFHTEMGLTNTQMNFSYTNLGGRPTLDVLGGVKYYLISDNATHKAPYNYSDRSNIVAKETLNYVPYAVYEASHTLPPLGFTYANTIARDTYDALTPLQKQESLLQGVVLEDSSLPQAPLSITSQSVPYTVGKTDGLTFEDGKVVAKRANATLTLHVEGKPNTETYLYCKALNYAAVSPSAAVPAEKWEKYPWYKKMSLYKKDSQWVAPAEYTILLQADHGSGYRNISNFTSTSHLYGGKTTWLSNLGYSEKAQSSITLSFSQAGEYDFEGLEILCQPMNNFNDQVDALGQTVMQNTEVGTNCITGSIDLQQRRALYFSIPYSEGWTAFVDGNQVPIKKANTAFMALELDAGHHDVRLVYCTPGLVAGGVLSCIGLGLCGVIFAWNFAQDRRKKRVHHG
ncbi:MAG: YfhO family protein [Eggerthellaceae bacterium]